MAKASSSNGASERPPDWDKWLPMLEVTKRLDCSHKTIRGLASEDMIRSEFHDGERRYNPIDVEAAKSYVDGMPEDEKNPKPKPVGGISHEEFAGATSLVKQVHHHLSTMIPLLTSSWEKVMNIAKEQSERDGRRIAELERLRDQSFTDREKMLSEESTRLMSQKMLEASEARKNKAFTALVDGVGPVIVQKLGLQSDPKVGAALNLMKSLKREQLLLLLQLGGDGGLLTPEQVGFIRKFLGELSPEEQSALGAEKTEEKKDEEK